MSKGCFLPTSEGLLEPIRPWLADPQVSEIMLNHPKEIWVEKQGQLHSFEVPKYDDQTLNHLFQLIATENHQELSVHSPMLSGNLLDGTRIQLVLPPIAKHRTFSIRRKTVQSVCLDDCAQQNYYQTTKPAQLNQEELNKLPDTEKTLITLFQSNKWDAFLRQAIALRKNIVISGGTSSGKTTFLNACLKEIDSNERLITLEDTREIEAVHPNQVNLLAIRDKPGVTPITMQNLVQCSLRLRPDRIILGEIRGKEVMDFVNACASGHPGTFTTVHADNPKLALMRMIQLYKQNNVPAMRDSEILEELKSVIDVIVQLRKTQDGQQIESVYYRYRHLASKVHAG